MGLSLTYDWVHCCASVSFSVKKFHNHDSQDHASIAALHGNKPVKLSSHMSPPYQQNCFHFPPAIDNIEQLDCNKLLRVLFQSNVKTDMHVQNILLSQSVYSAHIPDKAAKTSRNASTAVVSGYIFHYCFMYTTCSLSLGRHLAKYLLNRIWEVGIWYSENGGTGLCNITIELFLKTDHQFNTSV